MSRKTKLELNWIGKDHRSKIEPRILVEDTGLSYHAIARHSPLDSFDNKVIHGDNLLALKALEADYQNQIKCVFIDPPYNTKSAFEYYDDGIEHSLWLTMVRDRLEIIYRLLNDDGSLWITIDDNESHYLKVVCDEIFGRRNFVSNIVWQKRYARDNNAAIGNAHDHILVYAKDAARFRLSRNKLGLDEKTRAAYRNPNADPKGPWQSISFTGAGYRANMMYAIVGPNGQEHRPPEGRHWATLEPEYQRMRDEGRFWFGQDGTGVPRQIRYLSEVEGLIPSSWWPHEEAGHNDEAKKEIHGLFSKSQAFDTPKPERLIQRIISIASNPGDLVLDSFAGSGTTGAVAHKMGRRWIMIELGDHAISHVVPRMRKVIDGHDRGGVTEEMNWQGGGGFRFYRLAPSLLAKDRFGNWVISKEYNAAMLAEALCKHLGFIYAPSDDLVDYWRHGHSTDTDFIFVTTQSLTYDALKKLSDEVGPKRSLLVCCKAYNAKEDSFPNLTVKKIPHSILAKCEWGRDDYSLKIASLPEVEPAVASAGPTPASTVSARRKVPASTLPLFNAGEDGR